MDPVVRARGLVKDHGRGRAARRILDGVDLDVAPGEVVAVVGRSGSGKSTLLHLLGGLDTSDAGTVEIAGERLDPRRADAVRRRHIGFVFQAFHLVGELTGAENVLLAARLPGAPAGARQRAEQRRWPTTRSQARFFRVVRTGDGRIALETSMVDRGAGPRGLAATSLALAYLDAQGGRPNGFAGGRDDRNVRLYR